MDELRALFFGEVRPDSETDRALLRRAFDAAVAAHDGQLRKDGSPYIVHPVAVATDIWSRYGDVDLTAAALLHDVPEDCPDFPMAKIYADFGPVVGFLVDSVTKDTEGFEGGPLFSDKIEKLLWGGMKDVRCFLLKIADRDHNLQTIGNLKENKQIRMAFETQAIYQPLREILKVPLSGRGKVVEFSDRFATYVAANAIEDAKRLKESLCNTFFQGFDHDMFQAVYSNSSSVNWKIDDKDLYMRLIDTPEFDREVEVITIREDATGKFHCLFRYKKGKVFEGFGSQVAISSFRQ
jgi:hypothetical protein